MKINNRRKLLFDISNSKFIILQWKLNLPNFPDLIELVRPNLENFHLLLAS